jgi:hypothetical protein
MDIMPQKLGLVKTTSARLAKSLGFKKFEYKIPCSCGSNIFFSANRNCIACYSSKPLTPEQEQECIYNYITKGYTVSNTARYMNAAVSSVTVFLKDAGLMRARAHNPKSCDGVILKPTITNTIYHKALGLMHNRAGV